ncbi:MAG: hypothetical protein UU48_C0006G0013 [Candidatus Uhrbacteria bacterium GW2011_GWF2_41_16]|uniref:Uncharacterized protein n=2 Tax=Candidatus Uhriibacteriota TaxID=1752732 RepID=A0A0G0VAF7_9BACT|nr:MAG: hypothetical protein UU35_C0015G0010 [Candidatus Uhrbacteria bacterium GW2011_GWC2_41_11]KKR97973.1 MAG: hypothetical protein UU48_C0006G0013 [Candidatus Uhrbacteria bacterium GW2011_GWF2_41_16]
MSEKPRFEKEPTPKSFIRISAEEFNVKHLLDLLKEKGLHIQSVYFQDPREGAEKRITIDFIPAQWAHIEVHAKYDDVKKALESSDEFREHADKILGSL